MIYERVNWLNKGETGAKPINKTNLNQMDKGIYDLQNIELIGVEKTAPTECTTGDKYFNTTDKKIYTATADNTWGETGETPLRGILYVIISSQTSYYYDGDTLISIGGGASGGTSIPVSATPPEDPEDGALWVDTDDEGVIVEVDQEVSTSSKNAVSNMAITDYVNGTVLYENSTGELDNITLSKSVATSRAIEIEFVKAGTYGVQKVINPNGKQVTLYLCNWYDTGSLQEIFKKINISGTSITHLYGGHRNSSTSGTPTIEAENSVAITKVISYEEV